MGSVRCCIINKTHPFHLIEKSESLEKYQSAIPKTSAGENIKTAPMQGGGVFFKDPLPSILVIDKYISFIIFVYFYSFVLNCAFKAL